MALAQGRGNPPAQGFADLAERLLPAVVNISTTQTVRQDRNQQQGPQQGPQGERRRGPEVPQFPPGSPFEEFFREFFDRQGRPDAPPRRTQSLGSGFVIDSTGYVVTNNHVIAEADEIKVILHDDTQLAAKVIGRDPKTDLAVLKVEPSKPLTAVKFGNSDQTRVGDWVVAIGNPFGLGGTVTAGIVSARARDINAGPYDDFIQTDASINRGNSGGPMFNLAGEVIGINTAIYSPSGGSVGIGFAIPANLAKPVIDQLRVSGKVRRGWLGVQIQSVTDEIAESLGLSKARGALVARVTENSPAAKGKIESGDVILKFDGKDVTEMRRLPRYVAETPVDRTVKVEVHRKGKSVMLDVTIGELDESEQVAAAPRGGQRGQSNTGPTVDALGMSLSAITPELRERFEVAEKTKGVLITKVAEGTPAAERGLRPGDVIVEIDQEEVTSPAQVAQKVKDARAAGKKKSILVMIERQGEQRFVGLSLGS
ncbi:MAG TPA: DegQ family serine endoprotease [Alphaproteobacteria bacterium]|nr:DegQ family serine endoprotease [Alphaproteobacteria bacterium]